MRQGRAWGPLTGPVHGRWGSQPALALTARFPGMMGRDRWMDGTVSFPYSCPVSPSS